MNGRFKNLTKNNYSKGVMFMFRNNFLNRFIFSLVLLSMMCVSCNTQYILNIHSDNKKSSNTIVMKIQEFRKNGQLNYLDLSNGRFASSEEEVNALLYFVDNTEECIAEIQSEENGEKILDVLNAIYGEATVGEVYDAMLSLSSELANEYETALVNIYNEDLDTSDRSIYNLNSIRNIKLSFSNNACDSSCRNIDLSKSYNWGSVIGYIGASAAAIAGFLMYKFGGFWTRIAGLAAGGVGVAAMAVFIGVWQKSVDWYVFQNVCISTFNTVKSIVELKSRLSEKEKVMLFLDELSTNLQKYLKQKPEAASQVNSLLAYLDENYFNFKTLSETYKAFFKYFNDNTEFAQKTLSVTTATASVAAVAYCTGFSSVINGWLTSLKNLVPEWLTITLDSIIIRIGDFVIIIYI